MLLVRWRGTDDASGGNRIAEGGGVDFFIDGRM